MLLVFYFHTTAFSPSIPQWESEYTVIILGLTSTKNNVNLSKEECLEGSHGNFKEVLKALHRAHFFLQGKIEMLWNICQGIGCLYQLKSPRNSRRRILVSFGLNYTELILSDSEPILVSFVSILLNSWLSDFWFSFSGLLELDLASCWNSVFALKSLLSAHYIDPDTPALLRW